VAHEVIDHITLEDNRALFGELWRVLKPDGVVVVKSPSRYNTADQDKGHVTFFSPSEFRGFLRSCHFGVVEQPYVPRPMLGKGRLGWLAMQALTKLWPRERWAARIDTVARKLPR
jgi:SAM-dependent methyltransferase